MKSLFKKIFNWEYWPYWVFYLPVLPLYLWYGIRSRSFVFFSAANPVMELGGFAAYSKFHSLKYLSNKYAPSTFLLKSATKTEDVVRLMKEQGMTFPVILKPDKGERGLHVTKVNNEEQLQQYLSLDVGDILLQEFIPFDLELGVMYHRIPGESSGHITSIVRKGFLQVVGDGEKRLEELVLSQERAMRQYARLKEELSAKFNMVPKKGEKVLLEPIGNHCRGTIFYDANYMIQPVLTPIFDAISKQIPGFYFGRFDLRVSSLKDFYEGKNIRVMEINGANSEPAHIYDPSMSLFQAYRDLYKHWGYLYKVSKASHRQGQTFVGLSEALKKLNAHSKVRRNALS